MTADTPTCAALTGAPGKQRRKRRNASRRKTTAAPELPPSTTVAPTLRHQHNTCSTASPFSLSARHTQEIAEELHDTVNANTTDDEEQPALLYTTDGSLIPQHCNKAVYPDTGKLADNRDLRVNSEGAEWEQAAAEEIGRLASGIQPEIPTGTETIRFITWSRGSDNLANYFTKHRALRPFYLHTANALFSSCEGVLITSSGIQELYELEALEPSSPISAQPPKRTKLASDAHPSPTLAIKLIIY